LVFLLLAALGEPLFVTIGVLTLLCFNLGHIFAQHGLSLDAVVSSSTPVIIAITELTKSEVLISIPLFTLAGTIMTHGSISPRLIAIVRALTGWLPGGLAIACVVACTIFAAISGSSSVTIIAIGGILYPALKKDGYGERFALGLITICGAIGMLIPPSLPLIVYGVIASNSVSRGKPAIADLFIAGIGPSILAVAALCVYAAAGGLVLKVKRTALSFREIGRSLLHGFFALLMPVLLLTLIYGGFATVHETAAFAVIYALLVELLLQPLTDRLFARFFGWPIEGKKIRIRDLHPIGLEALTLVGSILIILVTALSFSNYLTDAQVPDKATDMMRWERVYDAAEKEVYVGKIVEDTPEKVVLSPKDDPTERHEVARKDVGWVAKPIVGSKLGFLVAVNILLLVVGCIMDIFSGIICLAPLLVPMAQAYGVDLVHLGIIFAFNLELGLAHPPLGINLFIAQSYFRKSIMQVTLAALPFIGLMLGVLAALTYWDPLSLWLVELAHRGPS
jgi:C4-dicarboxylate transporter DctM subunit